jgi:isopenicillin N synthase-like dioxygenase
MRVNFYPRCPQPELTLGVAAHSDPGGMTMLLVDDHVRGLQVRSPDDGKWITVDPVPDAFIVNVGDQIQVRTRMYVDRYAASSVRARGINT